MTGNTGDKGGLVHERVASILPFSVAEKIVDKPLRIRGLAMTSGLSRNFNLYTPEELEAFSGKLTDAPVYLEHVSVNDAVGKVTKTEWDGQNLLYEAEIYDEDTAQKIRKGLIRHVSVGADYEALDVTASGKVPRGLHNAELSLVAVPGIPETNISVLERLCESLAAGKQRLHLSARMREVLEPLGSEFLQCVFCGKPGEYLVSVCTSCGDNAQSLVQGQSNEGEKMDEKEIDELAEKLAAKLKPIKEAVMLKCPKCGEEFDAAQWEANGWKCPNAECGVEVVPLVLREEQTSTGEAGTPKTDAQRAMLHFSLTDEQWDALSEEEKQSYISKLPAPGSGRQDVIVERLQAKLSEAEGKLTEANGTIEKLKALMPGVDLLSNPPKLMPISEALRLVNSVMPSRMVQRSWGLGPQRMCQELARVTQKLERRQK